MEISYTSVTPRSDFYRKARILVTSIFFMWGLSYGLLEVLNKHFQEILHVSKAQSGLLQMAYFGAYFLMAFPAASFMQRSGYKNGLILGLGLYAVGALLFIPASFYGQFEFFLGALFVLASGLACLETASNPYMVILGNSQGAEKRLNLAQSFCGLGVFIGPFLGGLFLFNGMENGTRPPTESMQMLYACLACVVILVAFFVSNSIVLSKCEGKSEVHHLSTSDLFSNKRFIFGVVAQFFYVAAQVGIGAFFINYVISQDSSITSKQGAFLLSTALFIFMCGRFVSTWLIGYFKPSRLLSYYSLLAIILCSVVIAGIGSISIIALIGIFFFMSMMFPTIFSTAIKDAGQHTKRCSSILMMALIGGALSPYVMGAIADRAAIETAYIVPLVCFVFVLMYGRYISGDRNACRV